MKRMPAIVIQPQKNKAVLAHINKAGKGRTPVSPFVYDKIEAARTQQLELRRHMSALVEELLTTMSDKTRQPLDVMSLDDIIAPNKGAGMIVAAAHLHNKDEMLALSVLCSKYQIEFVTVMGGGPLTPETMAGIANVLPQSRFGLIVTRPLGFED